MGSREPRFDTNADEKFEYGDFALSAIGKRPVLGVKYTARLFQPQFWSIVVGMPSILVGIFTMHVPGNADDALWFSVCLSNQLKMTTWYTDTSLTGDSLVNLGCLDLWSNLVHSPNIRLALASNSIKAVWPIPRCTMNPPRKQRRLIPSEHTRNGRN